MKSSTVSSKKETEMILGLVDAIGKLVGHPEEKRLAVIGEAIIIVAQHNLGLAEKLLRFGQFFSSDCEVEIGKEEDDTGPLNLEKLLDFTEKERASQAALALSFIDKVGQMRMLPMEEQRPQFFFLLERVEEHDSRLAENLLNMAAAFSDEYLLETHNPPVLAPQTGILIQVGEYFHRPLEEVLAGLSDNPTTAPGGVMRDMPGGVANYENRMHVSPDDMIFQIGGQTSPEAFGKDSYPKSFPPVISEHCQHTVFGAGVSRLINTLKEIVPKPKKER